MTKRICKRKKELYKRKVRRLSVVALTLMLAITAIVGGLMNDVSAATINTDGSTINLWKTSTGSDTKHLGRIWTDKTVSATDLGLQFIQNGQRPTIHKKENSDFLVGLSLLSSAANIRGEIEQSKPFDIVIVMDTSGSMAYYLPEGKVYADSLDRNQTYYVPNSNGNPISVAWNDWYGEWRGNRTTYTPKTSDDDDASGHTQFYTSRGSTKMDALKNAVNSFIDQTAETNSSISDPEKQHRISLVTFASNSNLEKELTYCTASTVDGLKKKVNDLETGGATRADYGMNTAKEELDKARSDVQKVVIFFTDGQPTDGNTFSDTVANTAITYAKDLKDGQTLVYSIGMFAVADPSDTSDRFNAYMHGVSSNYPEATAYTALGNLATDKDGNPTDYYKAATNSSELNNIFDDIFTEISESKATSPIFGSEGADTSGDTYVWFHDELGDYMRVDQLNTLVFAETLFTEYSQTTTDLKDDSNENVIGKRTTCLFAGTAGGNQIYPEGNMSDIVITVDTYNNVKTGDHVTVQIPKNMIPLRMYNIDVKADGTGTMSITDTYPLRLFYDVSLKPEANALLENPDQEMEDYIAANKNEDGTVDFYSNKYYSDGNNFGGVYAQFTPSRTNGFYYYQEDEVLYVDQDCTTPAKLDSQGHLDSNQTYYYQRDYWEMVDGKPVKKIDAVAVSGDSILATNGLVKSNTEGNAYVPTGTPRTTTLYANQHNKEQNHTNTAPYVTKPNWRDTSVMQNIMVSLGNNGIKAVEIPGSLAVTKHVTADAGLNVNKDAEFEFKLSLTAPDNEALKDSYTAQLFDAEGNTIADPFTIANGGTFKLKDAQTVRIYGLAEGTTYSVIETPKSGYKVAQSTGNEGTIVSESEAVVTFTNNYSVTPVIIGDDTGTSLIGTKNISGREFKSGDAFRFIIEASQSAPNSPLPEKPICEIEPTSGGETSIVFGRFTFDKPGEYRYSIREFMPSNSDENDKFDQIIPGVKYDLSIYRFIVNVVDNGDGTLKVEKTTIDKRINNTANVWENVYTGSGSDVIENSGVIFTNTYTESEEVAQLRGQKELSGKSLSDYGDNPFRYLITAAGSKTIGGTEEFEADSNQPIPTDDIVVSGSTGLINIDDIKFNLTHINKVYKYIVTELQPTDNGAYDGNGLDGARKDENGNWVYQGVTFDKSEKEILISVELDEAGANPSISIEGNHFEFNNAYNANVEVPLSGVKNITGREFKIGDEFTFNVEAVSTVEDRANIPMPSKTEVTIKPESGNQVSVDFGTITFTQDDLKDVVMADDGSRTKTFEYILTEKVGADKSLKYDTAAKYIRITVTDDGMGNMTFAIDDDSAASWTNTYTSNGRLENGITITKTLNGRSMKAKEFDFTITPLNDGPISASDSSFTNQNNKASGIPDVMTKMSSLQFTQKDAGKSYEYVVKETKENTSGVTYDESEYLVTIEVTDDYNGKITATPTITKTKDAVGNDISETVDAISFVNSYQATPTNIDINGLFTKAISGRDWIDTDSFTFTITPLDGAPAPEKTRVTLTSDKAKKDEKVDIDFGRIEFTHADMKGGTSKTFKYQVTENDINIPGMTKDNHTALMEITVTDEGGYLTISSPTITGGDFTNVYQTSLDYAALVDMKITSVLNGRDMSDDQFEFTLIPNDESSANKLGLSKDGDVYAVAESKDGEKSVMNVFANKIVPVFTQDDIGKTYTYVAKQTKLGGEGYTNDDKDVTVVISVTDNPEEGKLVVTTTVTKDGKSEQTIVETGDEVKASVLPFVLEYNASSVIVGEDGEVQIDASKTLNNRPLEDGEFEFNVYDKNDKLVTSGTNGENGRIIFDSIEYTLKKLNQDLANGSVSKQRVGNDDIYTYEYTVIENQNGFAESGIQAVVSDFAIKVIVTDDNTGKLNTEVIYPEDYDNGLVFENTYGSDAEAEINVIGQKLLTAISGDNAPNITDQFTFSISSSEDAPMPEKLQTTNDAAGNISFGKITFTMSDIFGEDPTEGRTKSFTYTVTESGTVPGVENDGPQSFTIVVTDNGDGTITATLEDQVMFKFENKYSVEDITSSVTDSISIRKVLEGRVLIEGEFEFELIEDGEVICTSTNDENGNITFDAINYTKPGVHKYTVREVNNQLGGVTYDNTVFEITTTVKDDGEGKLAVTHEATKEVVFKNDYSPISTSVVLGASKILKNADLADNQFTFELKDADGKVISTATNDADGRISFDKIVFNEPGAFKYIVSEVKGTVENIKYDETEFEITVTVSDNGKGVLEATIESKDNAVITFINEAETVPPVNVDTGDSASLGLVVGLLLASAVGVKLTYRKKEND